MKKDELKKAYWVIAAIGAAMVLSTFVYAGIVEWFKYSNIPTGVKMEPSQVTTLRVALLVFSAVEFIIIKYIRSAFMSGKIKMKPNPGTLGYANPVGAFTAVSVIVYALCESICIYGLVLFLITRDSFNFYIFFAISLVAYAAYFPRYRQLEEWARGKGLVEQVEVRRETKFE